MVGTTVNPLRKRGANVVVQANGQVLFAPGTDLSRWKNRFSQRIRVATIAAAPINKRPRWKHYGKPLKSTIKAKTRTRITSGGGFFYIGVGSSAPHAYYVDQGTGVWAGRGPYVAKVLPPYTRGGASLYESTWRPGGPDNQRVRPIFIKGQKPQRFFDEGLKNGFRSMRMRSYQVPGEGVAGISSALKTVPQGLMGFSGNTPADAAFESSLTQWRKWRDAQFKKGFGVGQERKARVRRSRATTGPKRRSEAENIARSQKSKERSQRYRDEQSDRKKKATAAGRKGQAVNLESRKRVERARFLAAAKQKYGVNYILQDTLRFVNGRWTMDVFAKTTGGKSKKAKPIQGREIK